jgi:hypothetical protein
MERKFDWKEVTSSAFRGSLPFISISDGMMTYCAELGDQTTETALEEFTRTYDWNLEPGDETPDISPVVSWRVHLDGTPLSAALVAAGGRDEWEDGGVPERITASHGCVWDFDGWDELRREFRLWGEAWVGPHHVFVVSR